MVFRYFCMLFIGVFNLWVIFCVSCFFRSVCFFFWVMLLMEILKLLFWKIMYFMVKICLFLFMFNDICFFFLLILCFLFFVMKWVMGCNLGMEKIFFVEFRFLFEIRLVYCVNRLFIRIFFLWWLNMFKFLCEIWRWVISFLCLIYKFFFVWCRCL